MDLALSSEQLDLQRRARDFTDRFLVPHELECELEGGLGEGSLRGTDRDTW